MRDERRVIVILLVNEVGACLVTGPVHAVRAITGLEPRAFGENAQMQFRLRFVAGTDRVDDAEDDHGGR